MMLYSSGSAWFGTTRWSRVKTTRLTMKPDAPTMPNLTNWRTPRRWASEATILRNPIPIGEEHREQAEQREREGENNVVDPRAVAPACQDGEHREEHEREARHRHEVRGRHRHEDREGHVSDVRGT